MVDIRKGSSALADALEERPQELLPLVSTVTPGAGQALTVRAALPHGAAGGGI